MGRNEGLQGEQPKWVTTQKSLAGVSGKLRRAGSKQKKLEIETEKYKDRLELGDRKLQADLNNWYFQVLLSTLAAIVTSALIISARQDDSPNEPERYGISSTSNRLLQWFSLDDSNSELDGYYADRDQERTNSCVRYPSTCCSSPTHLFWRPSRTCLLRGLSSLSHIRWR